MKQQFQNLKSKQQYSVGHQNYEFHQIYESPFNHQNIDSDEQDSEKQGKKDSKKNKNTQDLFKCSYKDCGKKFRIKSGLSRHRIIHSDQRMFLCDEKNCKSSFNQKSNLNRHKRIHKVEKPYQCSNCDKKFYTTTNLKQHIQIHTTSRTQRKKFCCQILGCNKQYLYNCNLKKHKQGHQDPLGECIGQKEVACPLFSVRIGVCELKICYKVKNNHSEALITYHENSEAIFYDVQTLLAVENGHQDQIQLQLQNRLKQLIDRAKYCVSICFEVHPNLYKLHRFLIAAVINLIGVNTLKCIMIVIEDYTVLAKVVGHLLSECANYG